MSCTMIDRKFSIRVAPLISTVVFLGYVLTIFVNLPPFARSDNISVNWNMLYISGIGTMGAATALAAVTHRPITQHIGQIPARIIGVEAGIALLLSIVLVFRSLKFFGLV